MPDALNLSDDDKKWVREQELRLRKSERRRFIKSAELYFDNHVRRWKQAQSRFLQACGWRLQCDHPGAQWLWEKLMPDGRLVCLRQDDALEYEQATDEHRDLVSALYEERGDPDDQ